jgi:hypothetical protein
VKKTLGLDQESRVELFTEVNHQEMNLFSKEMIKKYAGQKFIVTLINPHYIEERRQRQDENQEDYIARLQLLMQQE